MNWWEIALIVIGGLCVLAWVGPLILGVLIFSLSAVTSVVLGVLGLIIYPFVLLTKKIWGDG